MKFSKNTTLTSGQALQVRSYEVTDYSQVQAVLLDVGMFDNAWDCEESLRRIITGQPLSILVAVLEGKVVGTVYLLINGFWAQIYRLAVFNKLQNQGIGNALMNAAETITRNLGIPEVVLFYNNDKPELGQFYRRRGWQGSGNLFQCLWKKL
jgi:predicted N-acetyltransferase YhbS